MCFCPVNPSVQMHWWHTDRIHIMICVSVLLSGGMLILCQTEKTVCNCDATRMKACSYRLYVCNAHNKSDVHFGLLWLIHVCTAHGSTSTIYGTLLDSSKTQTSTFTASNAHTWPDKQTARVSAEHRTATRQCSRWFPSYSWASRKSFPKERRNCNIRRRFDFQCSEFLLVVRFFPSISHIT